MKERTYLAKFVRVGRNHNVPNLTVSGVEDPEQFADKIFDYARNHLLSKDFVVTVEIGDDQTRGTFHLDGGRFGEGTIEVVEQSAPDGPRSLRVIAGDVYANWPKVNYAAKPYLEAMEGLDKITDTYYADSARSIVQYFLANAGSWRGEHARRVKAELKGMLA